MPNVYKNILMLSYLFKGKSPGTAGLLASWIWSGFPLAEKWSLHESAVTVKVAVVIFEKSTMQIISLNESS